MSADNFILITKNKDKYIAQEKSMNGGNLSFKAEHKNLEGIIGKSNEYMTENIVEYGLEFHI